MSAPIIFNGLFLVSFNLEFGHLSIYGEKNTIFYKIICIKGV